MPSLKSIDPATGATIARFTVMTAAEVDRQIARTHKAHLAWRETGFPERTKRMKALAAVLRRHAPAYAELMAAEMGKPLAEGIAEIEKCAICCEYYAEQAESFLADEVIASDAQKSYVAYQALGVVLAVMPWNFPFWQVFRFVCPALMAGNAGLLKHASSVTGCALAIEQAVREAGFTKHLFATLLLPSAGVEAVIRHPLVRAVTLTGSTGAGRAVAAVAGSELKKCVLELGGSDAYVILADADLDKAAKICAAARMINGGQSCIAAKRFIVEKPVVKEFTRQLTEAMSGYRMGDPRRKGTTLGPQASRELRDQLHDQVERSIKAGATLLLGGERPKGKGAFYPATVLAKIKPGMPAFDEELFGPVAAIIEAKDEADAVRLANASVFGLGSAVFSRDAGRAERVALQLEAGSAFINAQVKSDPRLPFGGIKRSGYGRELSSFGIREFVNVKTVSIGEKVQPEKKKARLRGSE